MKSFNSVIPMSGLVLAIGAVTASGDAAAVTQPRSFITNPVGICQAALPAFEGNIRKRPLAIQNEGTSTAFVTCSFTSQGGITAVQVWFGSVDGVAHPISCTGVSGFRSGTNEFITKTGTAPITGQSSFTWLPSNFTGAPTIFPSSRFSISCALEPGVAIDDSVLDFNEDVGA